MTVPNLSIVDAAGEARPATPGRRTRPPFAETGLALPPPIQTVTLRLPSAGVVECEITTYAADGAIPLRGAPSLWINFFHVHGDPR